MNVAHAMGSRSDSKDLMRKLDTILSLLEMRQSASDDLATAPGFKTGTKWWNDRVMEIRWANRTLRELGYCDCGRWS